MYKEIFVSNVRRILDERQMKKRELREESGVSQSYITELTNKDANPSLATMEAIAEALDVPLPLLLEHSDTEEEALRVLSNGRRAHSVPPGYKWVAVLLPEAKAFVVNRWAEQVRRRIRGEK